MEECKFGPSRPEFKARLLLLSIASAAETTPIYPNVLVSRCVPGCACADPLHARLLVLRSWLYIFLARARSIAHSFTRGTTIDVVPSAHYTPQQSACTHSILRLQ